MLLIALLVAYPAVSPKGAVAAANPLAAEAGAAILRRGGNAVDAAVAAAFTLAVVEPESSGLAGGGFALVYTRADGKVRALDFRETGPARATKDMYLKDGQARQDLANAGPLAVAVPMAVKGYVELVKRWGTQPLSLLTSQAEQIARRGFQVDLHFHNASEDRLECLAADPEATRLFLRKDKDGDLVSREPGDKLIQPELSRTLHAIGEKGDAAFYKGRIARLLVAAVQAKGGILELSDLANAKVRERAPLESTYRGNRVVSMPLPSAGGFIVGALLDVLEREDPRKGGYRPERFLHVMIEAEKRLYALREKIGDPDFNPGVEERTRKMLTKEFAGELHASIGEKATPAQQLIQLRDKGTSSIAAVDEEGNAIVLTTTVNDAFGACMVAKGTGVVLNDEMDDFAIAPAIPNAYGLRGDVENAPGPGKVPLSSMAPTMVFAPDGSLFFAIGAAGGSTIPTTIAQAIVHMVDDQMPVDRAIDAPRIHHNLVPDVVHAEPNALEAATAQALEARGHRIAYAKEPFHDEDARFLESLWGKACGVEIEPETGWRVAACDSRQPGSGAVP